ncbi:hypothetical protein BSPWISOXPB_6212 [uncultured Gammaproteobacteria bacterium]|nr:hypothetical protein BSPWISOXPB_6212 [uncultured Gammaproteobacteria bacterium]
MLICPLFVLSALFALAWRFEPIIVVVLFGVLRFVLAMVGVIARVVIKVKIDSKKWVWHLVILMKGGVIFLR